MHLGALLAMMLMGVTTSVDRRQISDSHVLSLYMRLLLFLSLLTLIPSAAAVAVVELLLLRLA